MPQASCSGSSSANAAEIAAREVPHDDALAAVVVAFQKKKPLSPPAGIGKRDDSPAADRPGREDTPMMATPSIAGPSAGGARRIHSPLGVSMVTQMAPSSPDASSATSSVGSSKRSGSSGAVSLREGIGHVDRGPLPVGSASSGHSVPSGHSREVSLSFSPLATVYAQHNSGEQLSNQAAEPLAAASSAGGVGTHYTLTPCEDDGGMSYQLSSSGPGAYEVPEEAGVIAQSYPRPAAAVSSSSAALPSASTASSAPFSSPPPQSQLPWSSRPAAADEASQASQMFNPLFEAVMGPPLSPQSSAMSPMWAADQASLVDDHNFKLMHLSTVNQDLAQQLDQRNQAYAHLQEQLAEQLLLNQHLVDAQALAQLNGEAPVVVHYASATRARAMEFPTAVGAASSGMFPTTDATPSPRPFADTPRADSPRRLHAADASAAPGDVLAELHFLKQQLTQQLLVNSSLAAQAAAATKDAEDLGVQLEASRAESTGLHHDLMAARVASQQSSSLQVGALFRAACNSCRLYFTVACLRSLLLQSNLNRLCV